MRNKWSKRIFYPHRLLLWLLTPLAIALLIAALVLLDNASVGAIAAYLLAAYTLTLWCFRLPAIIRFFKGVKENNRHIKRFLSDTPFRMRVTLIAAFFVNAAYGIFHAGLALFHKSFWFWALASYYLILAAMRLGLWRARRVDNKIRAWKRYRRCGYLLLITSLALSLMVFFMIYWGRSFHHHMITTIAIAAYTFTAFTLAIVGAGRHRGTQNPVIAASRSISLAAASVSMLTLTATMLTTFGGVDTDVIRKPMLALVGGAVLAVLLVISVYMTVQGRKKLGQLRNEERNDGTE